MDDIELREGWHWPVGDEGCWQWVVKDQEELPQTIMRHCSSFDTVIHAGANTGFYVRQYASRFKRVYAIEPHPVNFRCLVLNCLEPNVIKIQAALSDDRDLVTLANEWEHRNCGGYRVTPGDSIHTMRMDDLPGQIDLVHLDVEGYEQFALYGGRQMLALKRPVVCLETIRPSSDHEAANILGHLGYVVAEKLKHDTIFVHKG